MKDFTLPTVTPADVKSTMDFDGLAALRNQAKSQSPEAIKAVAQQFEALFMDMMVKSMRDANLGSGLFDSDETEMYQQMWDQQISMQLAKNKGFGIAELMMRQLQPSGGAQPAAGAGPQAAADPAGFVRSVLPLAKQAALKLGTEPLAIVAQAALETGWGTKLPRRPDGSPSFNLFGIKGGGGWNGDEALAKTLEFQGGVLQQKADNFRAYGSHEEGFADYVQLLSGNPRYRAVLAAGPDVARYADALQSSGYATDPNYASKIKAIYSGETMRAAVAQLKEGAAAPTP
ncbi:MAG TPA: glucosaminidase domain-containing protein [Steroidobacteraceae bacterium]|nr:glucosaminidase domain-containing protein [Steroidobacteraceae bacterium]